MKEITFKLGERAVVAQLGSRVEKKALYGWSRRVAEKDGRVLSRGALSPDGRLLRREEIALVKLDPEGSPVAEPVTEVDGQPAAPQPSSFEQATTLVPVPLARLATFAAGDVYPLDGVDLAPGLYATEFSYRKAIQLKEALLLVKAGGEAWLFTGTTKQTAFVGRDVTYSFFDAEDDAAEEGEELDFSMV
jgi:hypothetical protein